MNKALLFPWTELKEAADYLGRDVNVKTYVESLRSDKKKSAGCS